MNTAVDRSLMFHWLTSTERLPAKRKILLRPGHALTRVKAGLGRLTG